VDLLAQFGDAELRSDALDLPFLLAQGGLARSGWLEQEGTRPLWSRRTQASLQLPFCSTADKELRLRAYAHRELGPELPLTVSLNGGSLGTVVLGPAEREFRLLVPSGQQIEGDNTLELAVPRRFESGKSRREERPRAVALVALETRPLGGQQQTPPTLREGRLWLPPGASAAFYVLWRPGAEVRLEAEGQTRAGRLRAALETDSGTQALGEIVLRAGRLGRLDGRPGIACSGFARVKLTSDGEGALTLDRARLNASGAAVAPALPSQRLPARPNVVVFLVDTLRGDHLGAYGHPGPISPAFDAFAGQAILFSDAWAQAPWTRPAVASIFTGLHAGTHGVSGPNALLVPRLTTLAEGLKQAGLATAAFVANHVIQDRYGFGQGFDTWNGGDRKLYGQPAAALVARALAWVDGAQRPFFLYVHTLEPHAPYDPPDEDWAPFRPAGIKGPVDSRKLLAIETPSAEDGRVLNSLYDGEVRENDHAFGALIEGLRSRGLLDDSLVVFTADHGEEFLDHGGLQHGYTLYQELMRVPLAVRLPGARRGGSRDAVPVRQVDLMPTLLALVGAPPVAGVQGRDLSARWLGGSALEMPELYSEVEFGGVDKLSLRAGMLKLILNRDRTRFWRAGSRLELYDLASDPGERRNLAAQRPVAAGYLRVRAEALARAHAQLRARWNTGKTQELTPEEVEQLRALGYVQ
jgi:arylsulfatase A-like enzyme